MADLHMSLSRGSRLVVLLTSGGASDIISHIDANALEWRGRFLW